uniref:Uncharacterized mitochondrial protein AtMg00810-like n=1 Tax=Tanacetum cinerariifolium TaxID=118510 RepID=A0A6L2J8E7_TANCI|nr:uncharacterized mitochondrial protein AtMg00810-like [Tanacetum cinerariifolium]
MTIDDNHDGDQPETSNTTPPVPPPTQQIPHTVSSIKLPILKKEEYDIWAMKIEHYLSNTDYQIWKVVARERKRKARTTLLMALPEDHLAKFYKMADAKEMWEAIKSRFGGNDESKKMWKYLLKQQFKGFSVSASEGPHKGYDSFDDLYNNQRVFERDVKGTTPSSSNTQNVAFVSTDNTISTKDKMRIEQYFLMIDYSLWEVILNGDSPAPTRVIEGVVQPVAPTTVELRLARKNELKAHGSSSESLNQIHDRRQKLISQLEILRESLSQEDTNLKFLRSLPTEWRTHTLIWRNKTDLEEQSLDDLFNSLKIYEAEVKSSSSASNSTQNIAFVSSSNIDSTNEPVSAAASVFAVSAKIPVSALPNIDADDLEEMDLKWQMAMLTAEEEPTNYALMAFISSSSSNFDNEVPSCSKACTKAYATLQSHYDKLTVLRQNIEKAKQERDDLKLKLEKFQTSSKNLCHLLASQTNDKIGLGCHTQVFTYSMFDCDEFFTSESDESLSPSPIYDRYQLGDGYHAVPLPYTGTFMPSKPDLVFHDAPNVNETVHTAFNVELSPAKPDTNLSHTRRPSAPIIEDWVSDSEDDFKTKIPHNAPTITKPKSNGNHRNRKACFVCKSLDHLIKDCDFYEKKMAHTPVRNHAQRGNHQQYANMTLPNPQKHVVPTVVLTQSKLVSITAARPVTAAIPKPHVTRPRHAKSVGNPQHALKDKGVIDSGCSRHMIGNMSYLSDFKELNGRYVAFGGNPKGGKIFGKGKIRTRKLDFDDVYFVNELKFNLFSVSQMCDKKNNVLFTDTECLVLSPKFKLPDENQVLLRVPRETIYDYSRFTWVFFLATKDETSPILKTFITGIENQLSLKAEAVNTACYVQNRVLVTKPQNKTPYELLLGRTPSIGFMRPFGCLVTILNTLDPLGKINGKVDEGFLVGNSVSSKAFRVFNSRTRIVQETLHINFLENKPNVTGSGPTWLFDIDTLTKTMNYQPLTVGNQSNLNAGDQEQFDAEKVREDSVQQYVLFHVWSSGSTNPQNTDDDDAFEVEEPEFKGRKPESEVHVSPSSGAHINEVNAVDSLISAVGQISTNNTNTFSAAGPSNAAVSPTHGKSSYVDSSQLPDDPNMPKLEDITYLDDEEDVGRATSIQDAEVWVLVDLPYRKQAIDGKSGSTSLDTENPLLKDPDGEDVDVYTYISMIGSLMYLTSSRPDIMFAVCACARFQVTSKASHLHAVKRIFRYLKGKPHLGLWYPKDSPFNLVAYSDSDYAGASLERKSTTRGCQFLRCRLIFWQCKKQTVVATSSTEAEYVAAANCYASEGFDQIIDFLNASSIKYALTVNPNIYVSCIKQFWTSVSMKKVNDVTRLQALVDKKKVVITEATIRDALRLDDAEGIICLPNEEIFTELARIGYEKRSTKLTFYKAFFSSQWKVQVGDLSSHTTKYSSPALTQKVFENMRMVGKGCSGVQTSLFEGMIVALQAGEGAAEGNVDDVPAAGIAIEVQHTPPPSLIAQPPSPQQQPQPSQDADISMDLLHNLLDTCTTLTRRVENLEQDKIAQALEITKLKQRINTSDDTVMDKVSKQGRIIADMDADVDVTQKDIAKDDDDIEPVELHEVVEVVTTAKLITEVVTAASATITTAAPQLTTAVVPTLTTAPSAARRRKGVVIRDPKETAKPSTIIHSEAKSKDKGKGILVEEPKPLKKQEKTKEQMEEEDSRALKRISETQEEKAAKKQKLDEEVAELKRHLQRVPNNEDDVYTEATPLAYKVKERFASSNPKNFSDDFLLTILTYMFEKPDVQAQMILLVERRYPLTRFTLDQMFHNVRLEVEEESKVSSELLRFIAMISMRIKKFHKRTCRKLQFDTKDPVAFDKTKVECFNCHKIGPFARDYRAKGNQDNRRRDVGYNGNKVRDNDTQNYAMMAYTSSNSGSENEVKFCSKTCEESYARLKKLYDEQRDKLGDASVEITAYTLALKKTSADESDSKTSLYTSCKSDSNVETTTSMPVPVDNAPKVVCEPKVWTDAPIIEEYESDSDDDSVSNVQEDKEKPSFAFTDSVKHVKTSRENIKETSTPNHCPKVEKQGRNGHTRKGLGYAFTRKTCFVCGSFSHLIRDCDFHEKRMAKQAALIKSKNKDDPHKALKNKGIVDSGCSKHMTGNKAHLANYQEIRGSNGRITVKGKIKAGGLDFKDVYYVEELKHYNLFSVSQMCKKKNKREYSNARTPQQNGVAKRKNMTFIEAARTMLADSFLPTTFWAKAINTACYVLNRVLVTKPQNKTPYELLTGRQPIISYLRPFGCHVTILNTIDHLGKFDGMSNSGFLVRYSLNSKAFRVYNLETKRVEENLHSAYSTTIKSLRDKIEKPTDAKPCKKPVSQVEQIFQEELEKLKRQENEANDATRKETTHENQDANTNNTNLLNVFSTPISIAGPLRAFNDGESSYPNDPSMPHLEDIYDSPSEEIFTDSYYDDECVKQQRHNHKDFQHCLFACFLSQIEPKKISQALVDESWVDAMQEELLQFQIQKKSLYDEFEELMKNSVKTASTPIETQKPVAKDEEAADVDVHLYRYLKGQPKLGLWYPKVSSFDLEAYSDSDYAGANLDRKSIIGEAEYVALLTAVDKDAYEKKLIQVLKIHTNDNVADLLTKAFDVSSKDLASPKQMALGKDKLNPLIVHSLLKTIWLLMHHVIAMKHWLFQSKRLLFWAAVLIKKANDVVKLRALIDGNAKRTAWNEFSCSMASAVIYVAPSRKFNCSKYIFDSMVRNIDSPSKFLMIGKRFSRVETPLFATMLVQPQPPAAEEEDEEEEEPSTTTSKPSMTILNTLMETCATLSQKGAHLEQNKIAQALEIIKLKKRVQKLEKKRKSKSSEGRIEAIDADEEITLVDIETQADLGAELQGMKDDDNAAIKDASAVEPNVFDDEEVTMTMAQTLIKMKAKRARLLDEQMAKRLHDGEIKQAAAREKHKKDDFEKAKMQEKHLDNIRKYQSLKRKPISAAQARKNMIVYLKNMTGYKIEYFKGMTYDKVRPIFERDYNKVQTLFKLDKDVDEEPTKKRIAEETLLQESFKKLKEIEVSYMLKDFNKEDLDALWRIVKEKFSLAVPTVEKEKALWVELKRLFEPDVDDVIWKLQRYMHYPIMWKLHSNCRVHQVSSTTRRHDMYMLTEKDYPLSNEVMTLMLSSRLQVEEDSEMARDLVMKIFMKANQPKSRSLDTSSK